MKTIIKILLSISIVLLGYMCVMSILTPIRFDAAKESREKVIIKRLTDIRKVELEYRDQKGRFTGSFDTLISFVKQAKKKVVMKEGTLTDKQLDGGLTEAKAVKIVHSGNAKKITENGLQGFVRDTAYVNMIKAIFPNEYTAETIDQLAVITFSNSEKFTLKVKNDYVNSAGIVIPLFEASTTYKSYLFDLNHQEMLNAIDLQDKLNKFPGLQVGSVDEPNNNAGNWE